MGHGRYSSLAVPHAGSWGWGLAGTFHKRACGAHGREKASTSGLVEAWGAWGPPHARLWSAERGRPFHTRVRGAPRGATGSTGGSVGCATRIFSPQKAGTRQGCPPTANIPQGAQTLLQLECARIQLIVRALLGNQLVVGSALNDAPVVKNDNHV